MRVVIFNEELRTGMQMYLALSNHFQVDVAEDEDDLMLILAESPTDLTLLDLDYGEKTRQKDSGWKLAQRINKIYPEMKIVGISEQECGGNCNKALKHGVRKVVQKPVKNRDILKAIK